MRDLELDEAVAEIRAVREADEQLFRTSGSSN